MKFRLKLPKLADTTDAVVIVSWLCEVGDSVDEGQPLLTVETDKAIVEVPSAMSGTLVERLVAVEQEIVTGDPIAVLEAE